MGVNEYQDLVEEVAKPAQASEGQKNPYKQLIEDENKQKTTQVALSMTAASGKNPDKHAEIMQLAKDSGFPSGFVERNYDLVKSKVNKKSISDYEKIVNETPSSAEWLSNPDNATISMDDFGNITKIDKALSQYRSGDSYLYDLSQAGKSGFNSMIASNGHLAAAYNMHDPDAVAEFVAEYNRRSAEATAKMPTYVEDYQKIMQKEGGDVNKAFAQFRNSFDEAKNNNISKALEDFVVGGSKTVGETLDQIFEAVQRPKALIYSTTQSLSNSIPSLAMGAATAAAFSGIPIIGTVGGYAVGSAGGQITTEVGAWINQALQERGYDITSADSLKKAYKDVELMKEIRAEAERKGLTTTAIDFGVNLIAGRFLKGVSPKASLAKKAAVASGEIALQSAGEATSEIGGQIAARKGLEGVDIGEGIQEGLASFGQSAVEITITAPKEVRNLFSVDSRKAASQAAQEAKDAVAIQNDAQLLLDVKNTINESKAAQRSPEAAKELINNVLKDSDKSEVYFQSDEWDSYWNSKGVSPVDAANNILKDDGGEYYKAKSEGREIRIPISEMIMSMSASEHYDQLVLMAKTKENGRNVKQANEYLMQLPALFKDLANESVAQSQVEKTAVDETTPIAEGITKQVVDAGFTREEAEGVAALNQAFYRTLAKDTGVSAKELFDKYGVIFERGKASEAVNIEEDEESYNQSDLEKVKKVRETRKQVSDLLAKQNKPYVRGQVISEQELAQYGASPELIKQVAEMNTLEQELQQGRSGQLVKTYNQEESDADRLARAEKEGFDTSRKLYHGGPAAITEFKTNAKGANKYLEGVYMTPSKNEANRYAEMGDKNIPKEVYEFYPPKELLQIDSFEDVDNAILKMGLEIPKYKNKFKYNPEMDNLMRLRLAVSNALKNEGKKSSPKATDISLKELLQSVGFKGIETKNDQVISVFDPKDVRATSAKFEDLSSKNIYSQAGKISPKAQITIKEQAAFIKLFEKADFSSLVHESSHNFLRIYADLASKEDAPQRLKDNYAKLLDWFGITKDQEIERKHHEQMARAFEQYTMEGSAPSQELKSIFQQFKSWMLEIYKKLRFKTKINDDIRAVFDSWLASEEEIANAKKDLDSQSIFDYPELIGMPKEEASKISEDINQANLQAEQDLSEKLIKDARKRQKDSYIKEQDSIKASYIEEMNGTPVYTAWSVLEKGVMPDGSEVDPSLKGLKVSKKELVEKYGKEFVDNLPKIYSKDGISLDSAAELFGFSNGDEFINKLSKAEPKEQAAESAAKIAMTEKYGDMMSDDAKLQEEAMKAIHGEKQSRLLRKQLEYLASDNLATFKKLVRKVSKPIPSSEVIKSEAKRVIGDKKVRDIRPIDFQRAEKKYSKAALDALLKGDIEKSFDNKLKELYNHELYKAAVEAKEDTNKAVKYINKFGKDDTRKRIGLAGQEYLHQIDSIMERFEFVKGISLSRIDKRKTLVDWYKSQIAEGLTPVISEKILNEAYKVSYRDLPFKELMDIKNAVENINKLANLKNKLLANQEFREIDEAVEAMTKTIQENYKGKSKPSEKNIELRLAEHESRRLGAGFFASHRKLNNFIREMAGWKDNNPLWQSIVRPINKAGIAETEAKAVAAKRLQEIFKVYSKKELIGLDPTKFPKFVNNLLGIDQKKYFPEVNKSFSKQGVISMALNWGNQGNRDKLMEGHGLTKDQVESILKSLDKRDWEFVQSVWDYLEEFWPESKRISEVTTGISPEKVQATPIKTQYGEFKGGYYPIKYESRLAGGQKVYANEVKEQLDNAMRGASIRATTKHGHRENRVANFSAPMRVDLSVIFEHVNEIIHDQTHYEMLLDVNKLLRDPRMEATIKDTYGDITYTEIVDTINDVAVGDVGAQNAFEKSLNYLRSGLSVASMGFNLMTSLQQPLGLTQSMVRVGKANMIRAIGRFLGNPVKMSETIKMIHGKSKFMENRDRTVMREINEIRNSMNARSVLSPAESSYFWLISKAQQIADVPTWLAAYEKAIDENSDKEISPEKLEALAVDLADQAVNDSQGSGLNADLAKIQRGSPLMKLWTNFYSYFNTTLNLNIENIKKTDFRSAPDVGRFAVDFMLLNIAPATLGYLIKEGVRGALGDKDDDELAEELLVENSSYLLGMFIGIRETSSMIQGYKGYQGPAGTRFFSEFGKLMKQIGQGEVDEGLWRSLNQTAGILFHYPAVAVDRMVRGFTALIEGKTDNPVAPLVGLPKK